MIESFSIVFVFYSVISVREDWLPPGTVNTDTRQGFLATYMLKTNLI